MLIGFIFLGETHW